MKNNGFTLIEMLLVLLIMGVLAWHGTNYLSSRQDKTNFDAYIEADVLVLDTVSTAVRHWMWSNSSTLADNSVTEIDLSSSGFKDFLPSTDYATELPSGRGLRAFVQVSEPFPGADPTTHPQVPKAIVVVD